MENINNSDREKGRIYAKLVQRHYRTGRKIHDFSQDSGYSFTFTQASLSGYARIVCVLDFCYSIRSSANTLVQ